jgi:hypothetical protein
LIYPFHDAPGVGVEVLFYHVSHTNPCLPYANPYVLRAWDVRENEPQTILGTDQALRVFQGPPLPPGGFNQFSGTEEQWKYGCSYARFLAGDYTKNCPNWIFTMYVNTIVSHLPSLTFTPMDGNVVGEINHAYSNIFTVTQYVNLLSPSQSALRLTGAIGQLVEVLQVYANPGQPALGVEPDATTIAYGGLRVPYGYATVSWLLRCEVSGGVGFQVNNTGEILTNQTSSASTLPGSVVATMPIYNPSGTQVGVIPVYGSGGGGLTTEIYDDFISFSGVPLNGINPSPIDLPGNPWVDAQGGSFGTGTTQKLNGIGTMLTAGSASISLASVDSTFADCTLTGSLVFSGQATTSIVGIIFRQQDTANYLGLQVARGTGIQFFNVIAGVASVMLTVPFLPAQGVWPYTIQLLGADAFVTIGPFTFTVALLPFTSETKHGFYVVSPVVDTGSGCQNFEVLH